MSGYFQRLIARDRGSGLAVRPLSTQPYATLPQEKLLTGRDEQLIDTPPPAANLMEVTDRVVRDTTPANEAAGKTDPASKTGITDAIDSPIVTHYANKSAMATDKRRTQTVPAQTMAHLLHDDRHEMTSQHLSHEVVETSSSPSSLRQSPFSRLEGDATKLNEQNRQSAEEFHLMPLIAPSSPANPFKPSSALRHEMDKSSGAGLVPSGPYRHQPVAPEPPTIQVTIGRVEIRAMASPAPSRKTSARSPAMSLEEYLKQRNGGQR